MPGLISAPCTLYLPPLHSFCSWKAWVNPHHEQIFPSSRRWTSGYDVLPPRKLDSLNKTAAELLAAWMFPYATPDGLRLCCDFMNVLFVLEEITDDQSSENVATTCSAFICALGDEKYEEQTNLCRMVKDFRSRCLPVTSEASYNRLLRFVEDYINGVKIEAELREKGIVLDEEAFVPIRRANSGTFPMFGMFGWCLGLDLPEYVFDDPIFNAMLDEAADLVIIANDIYSYKKEQTPNQYANNLLTVLQKHNNISLQDAVDRSAAHFKTVIEKFEMDKKCLPSFGEELDARIHQYISAVQCVVSGNIAWSFETQRYFGDRGAEIRQSGVVEISSFVPRE